MAIISQTKPKDPAAVTIAKDIVSAAASKKVVCSYMLKGLYVDVISY